MTTETALQAGNVCTLLKAERDIELIPAGTRVTLTSQQGSCWNCRGVVNGTERHLLVFTKNLKPVPN